MNKGKALVAGGTGFLGSNLVKRLVAEGYSVRATHHQREPVVRDSRVEHLRADLTRKEDCAKATEGMDYVFHCAAVTSGAAVMATNPLAHVTPNVVMNAQLLEAAYAASVKKFLFVSSSAAYPDTQNRPTKEAEMFAGDPYPSYYAVGWMKRYAEILCEMYATKIPRPMPTVVVRPSNIFGPGDKFDFKTSHVMAALIRRVVERQAPFTVWGNGQDIKDFIFIDDFLDGLLLAFEKTSVFDAFNIANGLGHSIVQVLQMLLELDGFHDADVRFDPSKPSMIPVRLVDTAHADFTLGFQAKTPLPEALQLTLAWYRSSHGPGVTH